MPKTVKIVEHIHENDRIGTLVLDDEVHCDPGQFVMLWLPRLDEKPYSIAMPKLLTITYAIFGPFTKALRELKAGDKIGWRGPLGHGFEIMGSKVLVVAGGVGLASVRHLIMTLRSQSIAVDLVIGAKTSAELYGVDEFKAAGCDVYVCTDDGSAGFKGYTTEQTDLLLAQNKYDQVYACGPEIMLVKLRDILQKTDVDYQFSLERYMKCGIGICDMCSIDGHLTCQEGPVFHRDAVSQMQEFGRIYRISTGEDKPIGQAH